MANHHHAAIAKKIAIGQAGLERITADIQIDLLPAVAEIRRTKQVPAQPDGNDGTRFAATDYAEQGALIRRFQLFPGLTEIGGAKHAAPFTNDEQAGILDRGDGVQEVAVIVLEAGGDSMPVRF